MLGRLEMTVDECIERYKTFMTRVFVVSWTAKAANVILPVVDKYDARVLEACIKEVVREKLGDENALLLDDREDACKV